MDDAAGGLAGAGFGAGIGARLTGTGGTFALLSDPVMSPTGGTAFFAKLKPGLGDLTRDMFADRAAARARRAAPIIMNNPKADLSPAFATSRSWAAMATADEPMPSGPGPRPARTGGDDMIKTVKREEPKVGRNDPCPCGSGKKYKKCHGAAA